MYKKIKLRLIAIYVFFWSFWLVYSFGAGYPLKLETVFLVIVSFVGFFAGMGIASRKHKNEIATYSSSNKIRTLLRCVMIANIVLLIFALISINQNGFQYRYMVITDQGLFGNVWLTFLNDHIFLPLTYVAIVISAVARGDDSKNSFYTYGLLAIMSVLTLGRFPIYYMIYFYFVKQILSVNNLRAPVKFVKVVAILALITVTSWILLTSKLSSEASEVVSFFEILQIYVLNYHIVGYHMLDQFISSGSTDVMNYAYPTTSVGFIGWMAHLLTKYSIILPVFPNSFLDLMETFNGGMYIEKLQWTYNAFTTSILPFYADGGFVGVFLGFLVYGAISTNGRNFDCYKIKPMLLLVLFMLTFSLFQPFINLSLPMSAFFMWLFNKYLMRKTTFITGK